jgi:P-type Ca2+ transporter type 2C
VAADLCPRTVLRSVSATLELSQISLGPRISTLVRMEGSKDGSDLKESSSSRQRAPTITIDTSAVNFPQNVTAPSRESSSPSKPPSPAQRQRSSTTENRPLLLFESRLASPYNTLQPTPRGNDKSPDPHNLLAIPGTRSRGSSLDHHSLSSYGGETLFPTPTVSDYEGSQGESSEAISVNRLGHDDPLKADPGEEHKFHVEDNPFAFSPGQLSKLFSPQSLAAFCALGGLQGLVLGLRTHRSSGLSLDETALDGTVGFDEVTATTSSAFPRKGKPSPRGLARSTTSSSIRHASSERYVDRKRVFGISRLPEKKSKNLLQIMWITFNDKVLIILTVVAAISLGLGLYQDFGQSGRYGGPKVRWVEGVTIMVAVAIVVVVGSVNDYQKERQFVKLNQKASNFCMYPETELTIAIET